MSRIQRRVCLVCGSSTFIRNDYGFYTCRECGTQSGEAEERQEQVGEPTRVRDGRNRYIRTAAAPTKKRYTEAELRIHISRVALESFHYILRAQTRVLITDLRCQSFVVGLVGRIFVSYIRSWTIQAQEDGSMWGDNAARMLITLVGVGLFDHATAAAGKYTRTRGDKYSLGDAEVSMPLTLAILFTATQLMREPVTAHLISQLAHVGRMPYRQCVHKKWFPQVKYTHNMRRAVLRR